MRLSFRDLRKRDVINVEDGRCLGRIIDLDLRFPEGVLTGIVVPGRRVRGFRLFDRTEIYIDQRRIIKIGGDVILVSVNCGDVCSPNVKSYDNKRPPYPQPKPCPPQNNCPQPPKPCPPPKKSGCSNGLPTCEQLFGSDGLEDDY